MKWNLLKIAHRMIFIDKGKIIQDSNSNKDDFFTAPQSKRAKIFFAKIIH
ncbi:MAG: hypothetical protein ACTS73_04000 [Arsenophonus sp. NEOnobi-MAG3]